jgi:hypothetical protein
LYNFGLPWTKFIKTEHIRKDLRRVKHWGPQGADCGCS